MARPFVWRREQVLELFDSLYRGYPIGTLTLLEHAAPAATIQLGPATIEAPASDRAYLVMDGHQRIAALVAALLPRSAGNIGTTSDVYLTLPEGRFTGAGEGPVPRQAIPLREAFSTASLLSWWGRHGDDLDPSSEDAVDRLTRALREYVVPVYVLSPEAPEAIYDIFTRLNTAGRPLRRSEMFRAAFAGEGDADGLTAVTESVAGLGFGSFDADVVLDSILAVRGGDPRRELRGEFAADEDKAYWLDATRAALTKSIEFLVLQGVPHVEVMPTTTVLPVLAAFFHLHPEPHVWNRRLLARWLWRTWARSGAGRPPLDLQRAVRAVLPERLAHEDAPGEYAAVRALLASVPDTFPAIPERDRSWRPTTPTGRLALIALARAEPLGPDASPLDVRSMLDENGLDSLHALTARRHRDVAALVFWPSDVPLLPDALPSEVRRSHLITDEAGAALHATMDDEFVQLRRGTLDDAVHDLLSNRMELGAAIRPPLADLIETAEHE